MSEETNNVVPVFVLLLGLLLIYLLIVLGGKIAFVGYKCTDERIENHSVVCYNYKLEKGNE